MGGTEQLEESLSRLRSEIASQPLDDATRSRLEGLVHDLGDALASARGANAKATPGDQLRAAILGFEASHPRLAVVMNDFVDKLSAMGI